ncbi:MAG: SPOR domain-containing protein [Coriobacteriia bacterium]|nr:SPOR domain-containing protein [Coriobacteriia bacterium]
MNAFFSKLLATTITGALLLCLVGCMAADFPPDRNSPEQDASQQSQESEDVSDEESAEEQEAEAEPEYDGIETCEMFRLVLPPETGELLDFEHSHDNCLTASYNDTPVFEIACYDTFDPQEREWKHRDYSCGFGADADGWHEVTLSFFYMASNSEYLAHWGDKEATTLALPYLTGISEDEIVNSIELQVASGDKVKEPRWKESYPTLALDDPEQQAEESAQAAERARQKAEQEAAERAAAEAEERARQEAEERERSQHASSSNASAFWGVWIAACKESANAETIASEARNAGFSSAAVYTSTDWESLNPERWYVVSLGQYGSQSDAEAALSKARKIGYGDAYVKHTGSHK